VQAGTLAKSSRVVSSSSSGVAASPAAASTADVVEIKQQLRQSIEGLDRGIFGVQVCLHALAKSQQTQQKLVGMDLGFWFWSCPICAAGKPPACCVVCLYF
jgi:hypothetical protein